MLYSHARNQLLPLTLPTYIVPAEKFIWPFSTVETVETEGAPFPGPKCGSIFEGLEWVLPTSKTRPPGPSDTFRSIRTIEEENCSGGSAVVSVVQTADLRSREDFPDSLDRPRV